MTQTTPVNLNLDVILTALQETGRAYVYTSLGVNNVDLVSIVVPVVAAAEVAGMTIQIRLDPVTPWRLIAEVAQ